MRATVQVQKLDDTLRVLALFFQHMDFSTQTQVTTQLVAECLYLLIHLSVLSAKKSLDKRWMNSELGVTSNLTPV